MVCCTEIACEGTPTSRACVVRVLSIWCCGSGEQAALAAAGGCGAAAALLSGGGPACPALDLLTALCFENPNVAQVAYNTRYMNLLCYS